MNYEGYLEEYRTLRAEIMRRQSARLLVLGFVVTAIGAILGIQKGSTETSSPDESMMLFIPILIISALFLTIQYTKQIVFTSAYIRAHIDSNVPGICWETTWNKMRKRENIPLLEKISVGSSKPLAIFYAMLTSFYFCISISYNAQLLIAIVSSCFALALCIDLFFKISSGWVDELTDIETCGK